MDVSYYAQGRVEMLKRRAQRCVCKHCGGKLSLKRIIFSEQDDARIEIYCDHCERIEFGVEQEIYANAKYFVEELQFNCFSDLDANELTKGMNIAKVCEIMSWGDKRLGMLCEDGFSVPIKPVEDLAGASIILDNADLLRLKSFFGDEGSE